MGGGAPVQVLLLPAAVALLAVIAGIFVWPRRDRGRHEPRGRPRQLTERDTAADERFEAALAACQGLPARLTRLADAADAKATALRNAQRAGLRAAARRVNPDWRPPWELRRERPRVPIIAWQLLDRRFEQLAAVMDDPNADLRARADAYGQLGKAARQVAEQLGSEGERRELSSALARCGFCGKRARDVHKIIAGPTTAICDECVHLCVDALNDEQPDEGALVAGLTHPRADGHLTY